MLQGSLTQPKVLKSWTQMAHTQISSPNTRIIHKGLGSHKEWLGRAQEVIEMLCIWLGTSNPREWGWSVFYRNLEKLAIGAVGADQSDRSTIPVRLVWWLQTSLGHSLKKSLSNGTIGLGPGHVRRRAGQVWWGLNYNGHNDHRTCLVQDRTCPKNLFGSQWRDQTCPVDWTCSGISPTGLIGMQNWSDR
jgi:hypothetical protein